MVTTLREGFTTGTAAAAAAGAAVCCLFGVGIPSVRSVALPPFDAKTSLPLSQNPQRLVIPIESSGCELHNKDRLGWAAVIKDGGDDPDATHGVRILVHATTHDSSLFAAAPSISCPGFAVILHGGKGVGRVTLPGLPVLVGEPAINPEPRRQIAFASAEAASEYGYSGPLHLLLSVPDGEERARRTMNSRLGIMDGISILGTQGIVRPYSHEAWKAAISQGLSVAQSLGCQEVLLATGRRSERLGLRLYPEMNARAGIQTADYAAFSLREAAAYGFSSLIWSCFPGKLAKLAQGMEWTHASNGPTDFDMLVTMCARSGAQSPLVRAIAAMPTVTGVFALLQKEPAVYTAVLQDLGKRALAVMRSWLMQVHSGVSCPALRLHVFSLDERLLLTLSSSDSR